MALALRLGQVRRARRLLHASARLLASKQPVEYVQWAYAGRQLLENPVTNKGSCFTVEERNELGLAGLLPPHIETLEDQMARSYASLKDKETDLERHIYLRQLQDVNETLFYALFKRHVAEFLPILYTPTVGLACLRFSRIFRRPRGLFLSYPNRHLMDSIFRDLRYGRGWTGAPTNNRAAEGGEDSELGVPSSGERQHEVSVIVVTDGGRILGLGDLG
jgi:malate dehydrogenase (oxaloacetate-decarboxylating)